MSVKKKYRQNQIIYYHIQTGLRIVLFFRKNSSASTIASSEISSRQKFVLFLSRIAVQSIAYNPLFIKTCNKACQAELFQ
jgi:hypothetical protein